MHYGTCFFIFFIGKKLADGKGLGGAGRLTIARIDTIQNFSSLAIRQNKGDSKGMAKATKAFCTIMAVSQRMSNMISAQKVLNLGVVTSAILQMPQIYISQ